MPLTLSQRLDRLVVRTAELVHWRDRESVPVTGWTADGTAIAVGDPWPRTKGVLAFAASATVPEDWPLPAVRLALDLGGESLLTIESEAGDRSYGLDPYHQDFALPARHVRIRAESVARLPFGEPVRAPRLRRADLVLRDEVVERLHLLLVQIAEAVSVLSDHDVAPHLLEAAETALRDLDWPSASADYVARTAADPLMQRIWRLPDLVARPAGLADHERASVTAVFAALHDRLSALQTRFPPEGEVALTGHAHIDLAWLWPYDETRRKMRRTFHTALALMERSDAFRFNQSTAHYYAEIAETDPALYAAIEARAAEGRWETVGGTWVEPDTNMPTGESLARQFLYGQRFFERAFGRRHTVCWLPDCFGFSGAMPQLMRQAGIDSFFTIKVNWSETNRFPADLFWWEGLDGSRVLAHTFDNPMQGYNGFVRPDCLVPTWRNFRGKAAHAETLLCVGYGDGGGGVTPEMVAREEQLRVFPTLPRARWTRVDAFYERLHRTAAERTLPVWQGEIYLELHRGTLTSQSAVKRLHRQAERALITAETVAGLAHLLGAPAPASMEDVWRTVLKNEFHDILPGSSIREVYEDAAAELGAAIEAGRAEQAAALDRIAAVLPKAPGARVLLVNPSLHARPLAAELPDGTPVAAAGTLPPLAVAVVEPAALAPAGPLSAGLDHLENDHLRVAIAADGTIASLVHKASGREALAGPGNLLVAYPMDKPRNWDAWDVEADYAERGEAIRAVEAIEVVEAGPHRAAVRVVRIWRHSRIVQDYVLTANGRRLDVVTTIDWHDRRVFLRALSEVDVRSRTATFECAYGVVERPTHANTSWDAAMFEAAAHRFVDLSEPGFGLAVLNDAKYGHSVRGGVIGLSLLRSPIYPDPFADEGEQRFTYALMPHAGGWREGGVREEAEALNQPLLVRDGAGLAAGVHRPLVPEGIAAALSGLKPAEDGGGLVLRVYEPAGARGDFGVAVPDGWRSGPALTILEEPSGAPARGLRPFEVKSWRIDRG